MRLAAAALLLAAGCGGPPAGTISGTVTLDGKPVDGGTISFVPATGAVVTVFIQPDGSYVAENVPPGELAVTVNPPPSSDTGGSRKRATAAAPKPPPWPPRYSDPTQSGLKCTVQPGPNKYDAKMTNG